jgi:type VI secretion system secreted protein Hcp
MAIYLNVEGLQGDVTAAGHEGWIECDSMQWGVGRAITTPTGSSQERESSAPSVSEVSIVKIMDKCTPKLFEQACVGTSKLVKIDLVQTGEQLDTYMAYELENSLISSYSVSTGGDARPMENISFNFTKVMMKYTPYDNKHNPGSPIPAGYDVSLGKKV